MFDTYTRGQVGIGTLIVFIAMVLVAAIAAGVLINTASLLQTQAEATSEESTNQVINRIQILSAYGITTDADGNNTLGGIELIAMQAPGAGSINVSEATILWVDDSGAYDIVIEDVYNNSDNADGMFATRTITDDDDSLSESPILNNPKDRVRIVVDIAVDEAPGDNRIGSAYDDNNFDSTTNIRTDEGGLPEGETATLRITTASGATTTVRLGAPHSLSENTTVKL